MIHTTVTGEDIMGLFRKRNPAAQSSAAAPDSAAIDSTATESAVPRDAGTRERRPKREVHAFRQVPPYEVNEELAERIAMRAYGDRDHDGKADIPAAPFPG